MLNEIKQIKPSAVYFTTGDIQDDSSPSGSISSLLLRAGVAGVAAAFATGVATFFFADIVLRAKPVAWDEWDFWWHVPTHVPSESGALH